MDFSKLKSDGTVGGTVADSRYDAMRKSSSRSVDGSGYPGGSFGMTASLPAPVLSGIAVTAETALTAPAVWACINVLATDAAKLPLQVKREKSGGGRVLVKNDPRYNLVYCEPNKNTTSMRFRQALYGHRHGWGNGYAEIVRRNGLPVELHLHSPRPMDTWPEKSKSGTVWYQVDGGRRQVRGEDMIHVAGFGWNGLVGYSAIAMHRQAVGYSLAVQQFGAAFYGNAATPRGALKLKKNLNPEGLRNLRESFNSVHQDTTNAHRLLILEEGTEYEQISVDPHDAEYVATMQFLVIEICRIFRVPPHKVMDFSQAGSAYRALEETNLDFFISTLMPELEGVEQEFNRKLFTSRERAHGLHVAHDLSALLRGDMKGRMAYLRGRLEAGSITPDQISEREGDGPVPGGKRYYLTKGLVPLDQAGIELAKKPGKSPAVAEAQETKPDDETTAEDAAETEGQEA